MCAGMNVGCCDTTEDISFDCVVAWLELEFNVLFLVSSRPSNPAVWWGKDIKQAALAVAGKL